MLVNSLRGVDVFMFKTQSNKSKFSLKLTAFLLTFLFILTPLSSVFAKKATSSPASTSAPASKNDNSKTPAKLSSTPKTDKTVTSKVTKKSLNNTTTSAESYNASITQNAAQKTLQPKTDLNTGALVFDYPIGAPPGRNGQTPNIKLQYNSKNNYNNSIYGYGWTDNIPYTERINKSGVNNLYSENYYYSSVDGELVSQGSGVFTPKIEGGSFSKYTYSSNQWLVTDKKGTTYKFGYSASTRQDDPNDSTHIFKWMLEEAKDTNGNYITYTYYKNSGQIYPSTITYSNHASSSGVFEIDFLRSSSRSDVMQSAATGFSSTTNYLINEIQIKVNSTWTKKYALSYTSGDNGNRSLLSSIGESGQDASSTVTTLPATSFSYSQSTAGFTRSSMGSTYIPIDTRNGVIPIDVNKDSYPDLVQSWDRNRYTAGSGSGIWLYTPSSDNWQPDSRTVPSAIVIAHSDDYYPYRGWIDAGTKAIDANGDGLNDLLRWDMYGGGGAYTGQLNNGSGWSSNSSWTPILNPHAVTDLNGDGLPDYIKDSASTTDIGWDTGSTWSSYSASSGQAFRAPENLLDHVFADVNGDGLPDIVKSTLAYTVSPPHSTTDQKVWLNNGAGWTLDTSYALPSDVFIYSIGYYANSFNRVIFQDINGDGLTDILVPEQVGGSCSPNYCTNIKVYINEGHTWVRDNGWNNTSLDLGVNGSPYLMPGLLIDANGDGLPDVINQGFDGSGNVTVNNAYFNNTTDPSDLLTSITLPMGGVTTVAYKMSAEYKNGSSNLLSPALPLNIPTVYQISVNDNNGNTGTTTYSYQGGTYFFNGNTDRKFAGFNKVVETDPVRNTTTTYYHQGNVSDSSRGEYNDSEWKIGKPYRTEIADSAGNLYSKTINQWDDFDLGNGSKFVQLTQTVDSTYDGDATHQDKAMLYAYDNTNGNITQKKEYGEVTGNDDGSFTDIGTDDFTTTYTYATNTTARILGLPSNMIIVDHHSTKFKEDKYYYDAQDLGAVIKGNQTKHEIWKTGDTFTNTQKTYNSYGLVTKNTDGNGNATDYVYDNFNLYPASITNALNQTTNFIYDYASGQVKQKTDPNGRIWEYTYDGLGRIISEKQPDITNPSSLVTRISYVYTDTPNAVSVKRSDYLDDTNITDSLIYFDGLGRKIQEKKQAEGSQYATKDYIYNNLGLLQKESLPYFASGSTRSAPTVASELFTTYTYDPFQRITTATNILGATANTYNDWKLTITDANGKTKNLSKNAYSNLTQVDEHNSSNTYSTYYLYNYLGNLTKITDALGNIRNFTYDGLGHRLTAEDLHEPTDTSFGTWSYAYDNTGNLTRKIDPKNQTVNYTYDNINRQLTEDYAEQAGTEVSYTYDSGIDGIGRLTGITTSALTQTNTYNPIGGLQSEMKVINGTAYATSYDYDRLGNQITITNPDSSTVKYNYNSAGLLDQIQRKEASDSVYIDVVSNFDYSPTGQPTVIAYQNGATTVNTYDSTKLYRLTNKLTTIASLHIQNLAYAYDNVGNITQIIDASATDTSKTANYIYDDLYRLTQASVTNVASGQNEYLQTYTYNAIGDILTKSDISGTYSYAGNSGSSYANPHAATSIGETTLTYDNNGNQLTKGSDLINTWDYNNRLSQVVAGSNTDIYTYDPNGQRIVSAHTSYTVTNIQASASSRQEVSKSPIMTPMSEPKIPAPEPKIILSIPIAVPKTPLLSRPLKTSASLEAR